MFQASVNVFKGGVQLSEMFSAVDSAVMTCIYALGGMCVHVYFSFAVWREGMSYRNKWWTRFFYCRLVLMAIHPTTHSCTLFTIAVVRKEKGQLNEWRKKMVMCEAQEYIQVKRVFFTIPIYGITHCICLNPVVKHGFRTHIEAYIRSCLYWTTIVIICEKITRSAGIGSDAWQFTLYGCRHWIKWRRPNACTGDIIAYFL